MELLEELRKTISAYSAITIEMPAATASASVHPGVSAIELDDSAVFAPFNELHGAIRAIVRFVTM
jgi:hypothetical protein